MEGFEFADVARLVATAVSITQNMKPRAVVHLGEMGKFVVYDIVTQMRGKENEHVGQGYYSGGVTLPQNTMSG